MIYVNIMAITMKEMKLLSWNINGIRAAERNGFCDWLSREAPDILCLQETKAQPAQLSDALRNPPGYHAFWNHPERKGYSGVAIYTKEKPVKVDFGFTAPHLDLEGRVIMSEYPGFILYNIYFPNGKMGDARLQYKMDFYEAFLDYTRPLRQAGRRLIVCGDFNTAHKEIDLAHPRENAKTSGFLPVERAWMDKFITEGFVDIFRQYNKEPGQYTWWDTISRARERNVGWRIDYFFVTENLVASVTSAFIMPEVMGSDHCPVGITLKMTA